MNETTEKNPGATAANDRRRVDVSEEVRAESAGPTAGVQQGTAEGAAPQSGGTAVPGRGPEAPRESPELATARVEIARLQQELETSRKRVDELARAFQSVNQDREEFKQRLTRERERMMDVEKGNVALTLLEALDELDRCLGASREDSPLAQGVRLIRDGLLAKVQATGIERLNLVGKTFDPNVADAVDMEVTPQPEDDQKVVEEIHAGYRLKDRIIRPARVKVARYFKPADA